MRILYAFKRNPQDPSGMALRHWLPRSGHSVAMFEFHPSERGRFETTQRLQRLCDTVEREKPDLVFVWDNLLNIEEIQWCKDRSIKTASAISGFTSFHVGHIRSQRAAFDLLRALDWYFVPHAPHVPVLREQGVNAYEMPFFYDPDAYGPLPLWQRLYGIKEWDLFFAGGVAVPWGWNRKQLLQLLGKHFRVCLLSDLNPRLDRVLWLGAITIPSVVNWLMNRSKIVLGSDYLPSVDPYHERQTDLFLPYDVKHTIRSRVFTAMGAGACFLVERHPEIERYFADGKEIVLWSDPKEAVDRARYYLEHDDERRGIARRGHEKVKRLHTAEIRIREMLAVITAGG